uniref:Uncharacterized protein n=1 Tax=Acrobeloides nanus TaxID=290746 RepID=A0A914D0A5_9BILA
MGFTRKCEDEKGHLCQNSVEDCGSNILKKFEPCPLDKICSFPYRTCAEGLHRIINIDTKKPVCAISNTTLV